jgi:Tfp pilus assembly protein PilF
MKTISPFKFFIFANLLVFMVATLPARSQNQDRGLGIYVKAEDGKSIKLYDKSYALVIGVSEYATGWPKLPGVKQDIEAVTRALEKQGFQVTLVRNPNSMQLDKAFKEFIDTYGLGTENRLLFYFAGHGHTIKQSYGEEIGYIVPLDAPNPNTDRAGFMRKAMDMQSMEGYARRIQSKHALFLFDSCFSGSLFALSRAVPANITHKTAHPVRQFITSGSAEEHVPDQSIFRRQFIEAIEGEADANSDNYVTGTELGDFLQDRVINYSKNAQHPQYGKIRNPNLDKGDFVFSLPKRPAIPDARAQQDNTANNQSARSAPPQQLPQTADKSAMELAFWTTIQNSNDPEDFIAYLRKFPDGMYADLAKRRAYPAMRPQPNGQPNTIPPNDTLVKSPLPPKPTPTPIAVPAPTPTPTPIITNRPRVISVPVAALPDNKGATNVVDSGTNSLIIKVRELNEQKQFEEAIRLATDAIRLDPAWSRAYFERGYAYYFKRDIESAISDFTSAINFNQEFREAYNMRGSAGLLKKDYKNAKRDFTIVIRLDPNRPLAYCGVGLAEAGLGDFDSAISNFTEALRLNPNLEIALFERGQVYAIKKEYRKAIADYTKFISIAPNQEKAYYARASAYESVGDKELAEKDRQTAKALGQRK